MQNKASILKELQVIPGIGKSLSIDLYNLGIRNVTDLQNLDPEIMYQKQCKLQGTNVDKCVLYTFRCAVHFANHHDAKVKWWDFKDK